MSNESQLRWCKAVLVGGLRRPSNILAETVEVKDMSPISLMEEFDNLLSTEAGDKLSF